MRTTPPVASATDGDATQLRMVGFGGAVVVSTDPVGLQGGHIDHRAKWLRVADGSDAAHGFCIAWTPRIGSHSAPRESGAEPSGTRFHWSLSHPEGSIVCAYVIDRVPKDAEWNVQ